MQNYSVIDDAAATAIAIFIIMPLGLVLLIVAYNFVVAHTLLAVAILIGFIAACVVLNKLYKKIAQFF